MRTNRITNHPVLGADQNRTPVTFTFDGQIYEGFEGDTIASALLANGIRQLRVHEETGAPRAIYCNIGHCFECRVTVGEHETVRACMTPISQDLVVESGQVQPTPFKTSPDQWPRTYAEYEARNLTEKDGGSNA